MTTPATAIRDEIRGLIEVQIRTFGQPSRLTPSELRDCSRRAERIKQLGQELDRIGRTAFWSTGSAGLPSLPFLSIRTWFAAVKSR